MVIAVKHFRHISVMPIRFSVKQMNVINGKVNEKAVFKQF